MDYYAAFEISKSALETEKLRADVVALNLANANSVYSNKGDVYKPMRVISVSNTGFDRVGRFNDVLQQTLLGGTSTYSIQKSNDAVKEVYDPKHPAANNDGFTYKASINTASEMIEMMKALRSYQANIKAVAATKAMVEEALKIGVTR